MSSSADELDLQHPVTWLHRDGRPVGEALLETVTAQAPLPGVHALLHGEAGFVKALRRWARVEHSVPLDRLSISGYWRLGADDELWRAGKAAWNAEVEAQEQAEVVA